MGGMGVYRRVAKVVDVVETEGDATLVSNSRLTALCCRASFSDVASRQSTVSDVGSLVVLCHLLERARAVKSCRGRQRSLDVGVSLSLDRPRRFQATPPTSSQRQPAAGRRW